MVYGAPEYMWLKRLTQIAHVFDISNTHHHDEHMGSSLVINERRQYDTALCAPFLINRKSRCHRRRYTFWEAVYDFF